MDSRQISSPLVAAPGERLPQSTGMSSPFIGMRRETGRAGGDARERPVFPARSAGLPRAVLGTGDGAVPPRPGSVPVVLPGRRQSLPLTGTARGVAPCPGGRGASRWLLPGGQRGLPAAAAGARRPHRGHRRLAACPETWPAVPPASAAARGRRPGASLPGPGAVPHPPLVRAPCPGRCPRPGPGGMRYLARHLRITRLPPPGPPGVGMIPTRPSPAPSPPWPGSGGAASGVPGSCRHALAGLALAGCQCLLRAAVSPHRPAGPCPDFFES